MKNQSIYQSTDPRRKLMAQIYNRKKNGIQNEYAVKRLGVKQARVAGHFMTAPILCWGCRLHSHTVLSDQRTFVANDKLKADSRLMETATLPEVDLRTQLPISICSKVIYWSMHMVFHRQYFNQHIWLSWKWTDDLKNSDRRPTGMTDRLINWSTDRPIDWYAGANFFLMRVIVGPTKVCL